MVQRFQLRERVRCYTMGDNVCAAMGIVVEVLPDDYYKIEISRHISHALFKDKVGNELTFHADNLSKYLERK